MFRGIKDSGSSATLRRSLVGIIGATMVAVPLAAYAASGVVKIGVLAPLTGNSASDGQEMVRGVKLAVDEANKAGGVAGHKFKVVVGDTHNEGSAAVMSAIQQLLGDNVQAILTGYASTSNFEIKYLAKKNMPYLLAGQAQQTRKIIAPDPKEFPTIWSYVPSYKAYNTALPPVLKKIERESKIKFKSKTAAMITSNNAYSMNIYKGLMQSFKSAGWQITFDQKLPFGAIQDWGSTLAHIRNRNPAVIVDTDYLPGNGARLMRQFMKNPTDSLLFIQYAPSVPQFLKLTKDVSTGVIYNLLGGTIPKYPPAVKVLKKYKARWGVKSGEYGVMLYEMTRIYFNALRKVGNPSKHLAIGRAIGRTNMKTAQGHLVFDQKTHLAKQGKQYFPLLFLQIWQGKRVVFYPPKYATGKFRIPPWMSKQGS